MGSGTISKRPATTRVLVPRPTVPSMEVYNNPVIGRHTRDEWLVMYPLIERLYVRERRKLQDVMSYMERQHNFVASKPMYKKRMKRWGFMKYQKRQAQETASIEKVGMSDRTVSNTHAFSGLKTSMIKTPSLSKPEQIDLLFITTVRDWTRSFFDTAVVPSGSTQSFQQVHYGIKLASDLLSRGHGVLAGRMVRKCFLQMEDTLDLETPATTWNLTELLYNIADKKERTLLKMLIAHLIGISQNRYTGPHPFLQMMTSMAQAVSSVPNESILMMLEHAACLNAEIVLSDYFHPRYMTMYQSMLWDNCTIRFPMRIVGQTAGFYKAAQARPPFKTELLYSSDSPIGKPMSNEESIMNLTGIDLDDPKLAWHLFPAKMRLPMAPHRYEDPYNDIPASHFHIAANMVMASANVLIQEGALNDAENHIRKSIRLREHAHGPDDPRVVSAMWVLIDFLNKARRFGEAEDVEIKAFDKVSKYLADVSEYSI